MTTDKIEKYKIYGGEIELVFDPVKHQYRANGEVIMGVTRTVRIIDKSGPLMGWAVNTCVNFIEKALQPGEPLDEVQIKELISTAKRQHRIRRDTAADLGTLIHEWVEDHIKFKIGLLEDKEPKEPINEKMKNGVNAFLKWETKNEVEYHGSEERLYSREHNYAGTLDIDATVNGKRAIVDIKTSKAIYPEMLFQTAAYLQAKEEMEGIKFDERWIIRLDKISGEVEPTKFEDQEKDLKAFLGALDVRRRLQELKR